MKTFKSNLIFIGSNEEEPEPEYENRYAAVLHAPSDHKIPTENETIAINGVNVVVLKTIYYYKSHFPEVREEHVGVHVYPENFGHVPTQNLCNYDDMVHCENVQQGKTDHQNRAQMH